MFSAKGKTVNMLGFACVIQALLKLLTSAVLVKKTICKQVSMAVFQ